MATCTSSNLFLSLCLPSIFLSYRMFTFCCLKLLQLNDTNLANPYFSWYFIQRIFQAVCMVGIITSIAKQYFILILLPSTIFAFFVLIFLNENKHTLSSYLSFLFFECFPDKLREVLLLFDRVGLPNSYRSYKLLGHYYSEEPY